MANERQPYWWRCASVYVFWLPAFFSFSDLSAHIFYSLLKFRNYLENLSILSLIWIAFQVKLFSCSHNRHFWLTLTRTVIAHLCAGHHVVNLGWDSICRKESLVGTVSLYMTRSTLSFMVQNNFLFLYLVKKIEVYSILITVWLILFSLTTVFMLLGWLIQLSKHLVVGTCKGA